MHIGSAEFLETLALEGRYLLLERATPRGPRKRDVIWLKAADGRDLVLQTASGYTCCPVEVPIPIWADLVRAGLIRQDGPDDFENGTVYRPTPEGMGAGRD
jgi:hypothetical protein